MDKLPSSGKEAGTFLWERVINGPVRSRRLGISLGLNIIPPGSKLCTFNCPYCECGFNTAKAEGEKWPSPDVVADALSKAITLSGQRPDWVTFAGNGEPTMHPRFAVVVDRVLAARDAVAPGLRVGILSNGLSAGKAEIREALNRLDARMMKLDPGPVELVNGAAYDRELLVQNYRGLTDVIIQAMIVDGPSFSGSGDEAIAAWLTYLGRIHPMAVHLYSLDRAPADGSLTGVARERLMEIAVRARRVVQGPVEVF
jgi:hypothetical protein